jgi:hypothetical protein
MDIWIDPDAANVERVWRALVEFGAPLAAIGTMRDDLQRADTVVQLGLPPNRIDLLTSVSGIPDFGTAWATRVEHVLRERQVPFLGRDALILNKRASGRRKDLADIEALGEDPDEPAPSDR